MVYARRRSILKVHFVMTALIRPSLILFTSRPMSALEASRLMRASIRSFPPRSRLRACCRRTLSRGSSRGVLLRSRATWPAQTVELRSVQHLLARVHLLEVEHARAVLRAELEWLQAVVTDIGSGKLSWDPSQLVASEAERRERLADAGAGLE